MLKCISGFLFVLVPILIQFLANVHLKHLASDDKNSNKSGVMTWLSHGSLQPCK